MKQFLKEQEEATKAQQKKASNFTSEMVAFFNGKLEEIQKNSSQV
jgi:hypothetical protein